MQGKISSSWEKTPEGLKLSVEIPGNTLALVSVPVRSNMSVVYEGNFVVWAEGKLLKINPEVMTAAIEKNYIDFEVGSGTYNFKVVNQ